MRTVPIRVLGIDPGTIRTGVGILEGDGNRPKLVTFESVEVSERLPISERLKEIYEAVRGYIARYSPEVMALENVFFGKDVRALVKIGEARASAMLAAAERGIPVVEYAPARVKQAVSGNGQASKVQMQQMVRERLGLREAPPVDAADALAVALCHLQCSGREALNVRIPVR